MRCSRTTGAYTVNTNELNPNDPVVNTASEYMYQMATIAYHTLNGTQTVMLPETVTTDDGTVYEAGTYEVPVARPLLEPTSTARTRSTRRSASRPGPARPTPSSPSSVSAA